MSDNYTSRLADALDALVKKLELIEKDPRYEAVWTSAFVHGIKYTGPTYIDEMIAAKKVLEDG